MIYLCIPSHDEETTVGVVLWKIRQVMAELPRDYQLLVADDASTDRTPRVLEPYTRVLPLTVLRTEQRRGYATSLEMLLREAASRSAYPKRDIAIVLQADFTQDPDHIPNLLKRIESGADIAVSNATAAPAASRRERWGRKALNWLLASLDWPEGVDDPLTGYNAYRLFCVRKAIEQAGSQRLLRQVGEIANAELLLAAAPHARRVEGVDFEPRPDRRQRPSRTRLVPRLRAALAYRRGVAPVEPLPLDRIAPDSVIGFAHGQRSLVVESLRDVESGNGGEPGAGRRRSTSGRARRGGSKTGARTRSAAPERDPAAQPAKDDGERRESRRRRRRSAARTPESGGAAGDVAAQHGGPTAEAAQAGDVEDGTSGDGGSGSGKNGGGEAGTATGAPRRRRGRRGGRRRRGPRGGGEQTGGSGAGQTTE